MARILLDPETDILGLVDCQPDFLPGGALAVPGGDAILPVLARLLEGPFAHALASQDWHPPDHLSFASQHPGRSPFETVAMPYGPQTLWPDHCVQGTPGAALHPALPQERVELVIRKGFRRSIDSYSIFFENDRRTPTGLEGWLRARGLRRLFLAGLATDFCVAFSAEDAVRLGFEVWVIADACRGIALPLPDGGTSLEAARQRLAAAGVGFVESTALG